MEKERLQEGNEIQGKIKQAQEIQRYLTRATIGGRRAEVRIVADTHDSQLFYLDSVTVKAITNVIKELETIYQQQFDAL